MESIEEEEGFGKGSTITSVKLKDVQDAYLDKSRRSLIHQKAFFPSFFSLDNIIVTMYIPVK